MSFKQWLVNGCVDGFETVTLVNELKSDIGFKKSIISQKPLQFYIDQQGNIVDGMPEWGLPFFQLEPRWKSINVSQLDPNSKMFRQVVNHLKPMIPDIDTWSVSVVNLSHHRTPARQGGKSSRQASFYMKNRRGDGIPDVLYHGTSTELWHDGIKQKGLQPRKSQGGFGSFGSYGADNAISMDDRVYLSIDPDAAARGAAEQASNAHGGFPLILKIDSTGLFPERFAADEDIERMYQTYVKSRGEQRKIQPELFSVRGMGTLAYKGRVPPSLIMPLSFANREEMTNSRGNKFTQWKWLPWPKDGVGRADHPAYSDLMNKGSLGFNIQSPVFFALFDAGIVDEEGKLVKKDATNRQFKNALNNAPWGRDAVKISKDFNDWGMQGLKSLDRWSYEEVPDDKKRFVQYLIDAGSYYKEHGWLSKSYSAGKADKVVKLAKTIYEAGLSYDDLVKNIMP